MKLVETIRSSDGKELTYVYEAWTLRGIERLRSLAARPRWRTPWVDEAIERQANAEREFSTMRHTGAL